MSTSGVLTFYLDYDYLYKKPYPDEIGRQMRHMYEIGKVRNDKEFEEVLQDVLFGCKR